MHNKRDAFTLIELLLVLANIGVLAGIVIMAINPNQQMITAANAERRSNAKQVMNAVYQYVIDGNELPADIGSSAAEAKPICEYGQSSPGNCVNLDVLVNEKYLAALPVDPAGEGFGTIGYEIYTTEDQIHVTPQYLGVSRANVTPQMALVTQFSVTGTELDGARTIDVVGDYVYVATYAHHSLTVIDVSDPSNPQIVGSLEDTPSIHLSFPADVEVVGNYAYVASTGDHALAVIDVSNPASMTQIGSIVDGAGATELNSAAGVFVDGNYAYVVAGGDDALTVVDISTPASPVQVGTIKDGVGATHITDVNRVHVSGDYAYVISPSDDAMTVIDISDPSDPTQVDVVRDGIEATELDFARDVVVQGNYAYVTAFFDNSLSVFNVTDPANVTQVVTRKDGVNATRLEGAHFLQIVGSYAFVTAQMSDASISIFDISNPAAPLEVDEITGYGAPRDAFNNGENIFMLSVTHFNVLSIR